MQAYIVHGYDASPQSHWFAQLKEKFEANGVKTEILSLPEPAAPKLNEWLAVLKERVILGRQTYLVGHSLGCPTILNFLQKYGANDGVAGVTLVSGLAKPLRGFEILDEFTSGGFDFAFIKSRALNRAVIAAKDDYVVPFEFSRELAEQLDAKFYPVQKGGHFLDRDGFTSFDLVYEVTIEMMK